MLFYVRDRKSIAPRKPIDIAKKENVKGNVNGNKESSTSSHVLKEYPNVPAENKFCTEPVLTEDEKKKISNVDSSTSVKDALVHNSVILAENLMQSKKHGSELPSKTQAHDLPDGLSVAKAELGCLSSLGRPGNPKGLAAPVGEKNNLCNENIIPKEGSIDSPPSVPLSTNPHTCELATDGKSQSVKVNNFSIFQYFTCCYFSFVYY